MVGYSKHSQYDGVWEEGFVANMKICLNVMLAQSLRGQGSFFIYVTKCTFAVIVTTISLNKKLSLENNINKIKFYKDSENIPPFPLRL